jgi:Protein of unknown function (DUF1168)
MKKAGKLYIEVGGSRSWRGYWEPLREIWIYFKLVFCEPHVLIWGVGFVMCLCHLQISQHPDRNYSWLTVAFQPRTNTSEIQYKKVYDIAATASYSNSAHRHPFILTTVMASPSPGPSASGSTSNGLPAPVNRHALTPLERQRVQLSKLLKDPAKPVNIPAPPKEKTIRPPREMMKNVQGSSAGAGSGEFHVYKANRRREYERLKLMEEMSKKVRLIFE